jgi:transcriptional regulator GlxA family with amidase domain
MQHRISIFVFPGFELLDASGPASAFGAANHALAGRGKQPFYAVDMISPAGGPVQSSCGIAVETRALPRARPANTFLVAGAEAENIKAVISVPALRRLLRQYALAAERLGSICAGTFILAALGLVDGKRVATHWEASASLAELHPSVTVDGDSLYVVDGTIWTSAGVTTGIDMALAMIGGDLDGTIASEVAKRLVVYVRRPGYQSQFSPLLRAQARADSPFAELIAWMQANLNHPLDVPGLAARAGLSERSFYRKFLAATGETPARFIESVRLDAARILLAQGLSLKAIANQVGLASSAQLTDAFQRRFGMSPKLFREMHAGS